MMVDGGMFKNIASCLEGTWQCSHYKLHKCKTTLHCWLQKITKVGWWDWVHTLTLSLL